MPISEDFFLNKYRVCLYKLPFAPGKLFIVENYLEAVGVMTALKAGVAPSAVRRPLDYTKVSCEKTQSETEEDLKVKVNPQGKPPNEFGDQMLWFILSFCSLYSTLSESASQEASMMFSDTPTVPQIESLSLDWIITRTRAAVPARALTTLTL